MYSGAASLSKDTESSKLMSYFLPRASIFSRKASKPSRSPPIFSVPSTNTFVISKSNLDLLLQYYTFDDYTEFYEENFLAIPEVEIDGYSLDEPDYGDESVGNKNEMEE